MSNDLTGKVKIVDTAATIYTTPVRFSLMTWKAPSTAGHDLKVTNGRGDVVVEVKNAGTGAGAHSVVPGTENGGYADGLIVETIDSGTLYIHEV